MRFFVCLGGLVVVLLKECRLSACQASSVLLNHNNALSTHFVLWSPPIYTKYTQMILLISHSSIYSVFTLIQTRLVAFQKIHINSL